MPSSTSSSSMRSPDGPWSSTWILGLALTVCLLGGMELFWRSQGRQPSVVDDPQWWAYHRGRASDNGSSTVVLLGMSRIQLGFSTEEFRERYPGYELVQLAINGLNPVAGLRDLARDESFNGIVICEITVPGLERAKREDQQEYVDYYHNLDTMSHRLNRWIVSALQDRLVVVNPQVNLKKLLTYAAICGRFPKEPYIVTHYDRSRSADYTRINSEERRASALKRVRDYYAEHRPPDPIDWLEEAGEIEPLVQSIQSRGGRVVFVQFPASEESLEICEQQYPREQYWDCFAELTSAATLNSDDVPSLRCFKCPAAATWITATSGGLRAR